MVCTRMLIVMLVVLFPMLSQAQNTRVEASGVYTGPLQTKAPPVLVELFSSENCPACPPADEYMGELVNSDGVIALSCHVDYFGRTSAGLGHSFCTERQTRYIEQIGRKSHFTPHMMINGHMSEIGYETANVAAAIVKGRSERVSVISIQPKADGVFNFDLPAGRVNGAAEIWLAIYQKPKDIRHRGETTTYSNVVERFMPLGVWRGEAVSQMVYPVLNAQSAGFAIVAQEAKTGKVLAAGDYRL